MNYVGQLAETVFVTVKELYRGLNPATLTGGIDVIVVRQPDGRLQCSPFHVRFGKLGVLRSKEKVVDIEINGEPVDLHMKLGDNGEAFFVEENKSLEAEVPAHLCTSPIPTEVPEALEEAESPSTTSSSSTRRKKRRKIRIRSEAHLHEEVSSSSEEKETPEQDAVKEESVFMASKSVYYSMSEEPDEDLLGSHTRDLHPYSDVECSPDERSLFYSRPSSPKSDSELWVKPQETSGPQLQWNWGGFPKVCPSERGSTETLCSPPSLIKPSERSHFRTIQRQASFNMEPSDPMTVTVLRPEPVTLERVSHSTPNTDDGSPTHQASPLPLHHMKPALGSELHNTLEPEARSGLNDSMANTISSHGADFDARIVNEDYRDDTTSPAYDDALASIINDFSKKVVISVSSEYHASTVSASNTTDTVTKPPSEAIATSVDKFSAFTETAQLTTAEKGAWVETDSGIEALRKGFAELDEKEVQGDKATVGAHTNQKAKSVTFKSEEKPGFCQSSKAADSSSNAVNSSFKAAESHEKKKSRF